MKDKRREFLKISGLFVLSGGNMLTNHNLTLSIVDKLVVNPVNGLTEDHSGKDMLTNFISKYQEIELDKRQKELSLLKTPAQWKARQEKTRSQLEKYFGEFPEKTPLNARVVGKIERDKYTIEKIIFESQPNYFVTANLYVPKNRAFPLPGILYSCGHNATAKTHHRSNKTGIGMALKGYVVLVKDPMGQGERNEYPNVPAGVRQHHYIARPSWLLNKTLSGLRVWDCIRCVDYLVSRTEVDANKLGVTGASGGGQMALLITAVDKRIKVCAASHPGGSMESTYLLGQKLPDIEIQSLIAPRPLRIIAGTESREGPGHQRKLNNMYPFYEGLGYNTEGRAELVMVPGVHSFDINNREAAYEWFNRWFEKDIEGKKEDKPLELDAEESLWCTPTGSAVAAGSLTTQKVNENFLEKLSKPSSNSKELKNRIANRIKLYFPKNRDIPKSNTIENDSYGDLSVEKLIFESEEGITIPSLLIKPDKLKSKSPVYLYVSESGKPEGFDDSLMPFKLANEGSIVLAIDVRGTGATNPTASIPRRSKYTSYTSEQWKHDGLAIRSATFGRTMIGMRILDMIRAVDYISSRNDLKGRNVVAMGDGLGGLWALLCSIFDPRISGVVTIGTLPSYKSLITSHYYNVNPGYFWLPGALLDFDIPDIIRMISPKPNIWIDPIGSLGEKLGYREASSMIKPDKNLQIITADNSSETDILKLFEKEF